MATRCPSGGRLRSPSLVLSEPGATFWKGSGARACTWRSSTPLLFPVPAHLARALAADAGRLADDDGLGELFYPGGRALVEGERLCQPSLARALHQIAELGADAFYDGEIGRSILALLAAKGSALSEADFARHESSWARPLGAPYGEWQLCTPPPNSQGETLLSIMTEVQERGLVPDHLGPDAGPIAAVFEQAMLHRDKALAGTRTRPPSYLDALHRSGSGPSGAVLTASLPDEPGATPLRPRARGDTVGVVAADDAGWWVSLNQSLFDSFGSGIMDPATGVVLQNRGAGFCLVDGAAGRFTPGARPPHTLMPTIVTDHDVPVVALATMGGSAHPQIQAEVIMSLSRGHDPRSAAGRPRWLIGGTSGQDYSVCVTEAEVPDAVAGELARDFRVVPPTVLNGVGHVQVIGRLDGQCRASADYRSEGEAYPAE
jgi:gamma-glutamyltranspeptidase